LSGAGVSGLASLAGGGGVGSGAGADAGGGGGGASSFFLQLANVKAKANRVITDNDPNCFFMLPPTQKSLTSFYAYVDLTFNKPRHWPIKSLTRSRSNWSHGFIRVRPER